MITSDPINTSDDMTARVVIHDLAGQPLIEITDLRGDGQTIQLTPDQIVNLSHYANNLERDSRVLIDAHRLDAHHPLNTPALAAKLVGDDVRGLRTSDHPRVLYPASAAVREPDRDGLTRDQGTPTMIWNGATLGHMRNPYYHRRNTTNETPETDGWRLSLVGITDVTMGFAAWNDAEGIANLVAAMDDPEGIFVMAGMINPTEAGALSARLTARNLKNQRQLPNVQLPPIRKALTDAGLGGISDHDGGRARVLAVNVDGRKLPIAIAIMAPAIPAGTTVLTEAEREGMQPWEIRQANDQRAEAARAAWVPKAKTVITNAGWRVVDLPAPRLPWRTYGSNTPVLWATKLTAQQWSGLNAAAERAARELEMSRGSTF